jgi:hypothetical protein
MMPAEKFMAKVLGKPGRFVEDQSVKKSRQYFLGLFIAATVVSGVCGFYVGVARTLGLASLAVLVCATITITFMVIFQRVVFKNLDAIERARISFRKGAVGEAVTALILNDFPDDYYVIHGLTTPQGDLDHVVVGPTGVYLIDTKNWKGIVSSDGKGELLVNGKPTEKAAVKTLVGRTMGIREQVLSLCANDQAPQSEAPFFHAVLVFPAAKVEARWGSTGAANCVSDEKLWDYIGENPRGATLTKQQIESYAKAFRALAQMDSGFDVQTSNSPSRAS